MVLSFRQILALVCIVAMVYSCVPPKHEVITDINIDLSNPEYQRLYDHQDKQEIDSLLTYFNHPDPAYRLTAINAMASIKQDIAIDSLIQKLSDPVIEVRAAAAYALGQIGNKQTVDPLMNAFVNKDTIDVDNVFNSAILEAVGKTGNKSLLDALASVESYRSTDTLLLLGQTRAIYRFGYRGITSQKATNRMIDVASSEKHPDAVRTMAANYLARAKDIDISKGQFRISEILTSNAHPNIRMAAALALKKVSDPEIMKILQSQLRVEKDYRVQVNILRALGSYNYIDNIDLVIEYLAHENEHVANTAAQFLINHGNRSDAEIYRTFAQNDKVKHSARAKIYASVLKHLPVYYTNSKTRIRNEILGYIEKLKDNPYQQAYYIDALGYDPVNYSYLKEVAFDSKNAITRTKGMEALSRMVSSEAFAQVFRSRGPLVKKEIVEILKEQFATGDPALIAVGAGIIANENNGMKEVIESDSFLLAAAKNLKVPQEIETVNELKKALAYLNNVKYKAEKANYNHPIKWKTLAGLNDSTIAVIKTSKGNFTVQLTSHLTPGTVANFVEQSNSNYYDNKVFHRVVPNFVIQGGCPNGDGYGALDYSIRSELPQQYYDDEGYIGMASAGNHTEGVQWFVTHSPTPHLDGNYTIFGKVIKGMEVVHDIHQGDKITDIIISQLR